MTFKRLMQASDIENLLVYHNANSDFVVLDVETTDKSPRLASLIDIQLSGIGDDDVVIFGAEFVQLLDKLSPNLTLVGHSIKYDLHVLFRHGVDLLSQHFRDTLLIGHLLDENRESYSLDSYVKEYFNDDYKEKFWAKYKTYEEASEADKTDYACKDIVYTGKIYRRFIADLNEQGIPDSLLTHVHRLQASLLRTEIAGIRVDLDYLQELGVKLKRRIDEIQPQMRSMVKDEIDVLELQMWGKELSRFKTDKGRGNCKRPEFSFESSKQLQDLLYGVMELPVQKNAKTRAISTDYDSLQKIRDHHPVVELICENRDLQKVYGTYIEGTLEKVDYDNREHQARIYPQFRVNGTVTGRISHSSPNLAQLPKSGGVRGIYVPDRGRRLISADYSQLEVIIEANLTGDKNLIRMLENGESKHDLTARELGCTRDIAKTLNFAHQYWCSHFKTAKLLGVSLDEGKRVWEKYWIIYEGPKNLKAKTDRFVDDGKYLQTAFGRRRHFVQRKRSPWDGDYRQAYNFLIQGTGADITSRSFYLITEHLSKTGVGRGLFTVHDEILIEADENCAEEAEKELVAIMERVGNDLGFKVPFKATSSGPMERWLD